MTEEPPTPDENGPTEFPTEEELPEEPMTVDDISPFTVDTDELTDINEFATTEWKESTTTDERLRSVIKRTTVAKQASDIANEAAVSENKARNTLNSLVEEGVVRVHETTSGKLYERDPDWHLLQQVHQLSTSSTLVEQIQRAKRELSTYHDKYGTDDPEEVLISDRELSEENLTDISHWRTAKRDFSYLRTAYRLRQAREDAIRTTNLGEQNTEQSYATDKTPDQSP